MKIHVINNNPVSKLYNSFDKFALQLSNEPNFRLAIFKLILGHFIEFTQLNKNDFIRHSVDERYCDFFLNNLTKSNEQFFYEFPNNLKIISWNYDNQIEGALLELNPEFDSFHSIRDFYHIFPKILNSIEEQTFNFNIIKLNGTSGLLQTIDNKSKNINQFITVSNLHEFKESLKNLIELSSNPDIQGLSSYINFGWERPNAFSEYSVTQARNIISNSREVIIFGYSFPDENHEIDKTIFSNIPSECKITYKTPCENSDSEILKVKRVIPNLGINHIIIHSRDVSSF